MSAKKAETDAVETAAVEPAAAGAPRLHEDAVRFVRQRLLALEEGRTDDADLLEEFLSDEFGLSIADVETASLPQGFRDFWQIPKRSTAERVTLLVNYGREPVWRIPAATIQDVSEDLEGTALVDIPEEHLSYGPSAYETPLSLLPDDPITGESFVGRNAPAHLQPRLKESGPIPAEIMSAIRPWSQ